MSGHSKWSQIKRTKEVVDQKKSQLFGKLSKEILTAMKNGMDPETNSALADVINRARKANMPQANISRLLDRHANTSTATAIYEGFGLSGIAFLITASTDNPNRTVSELRTILKKHGGQLGSQGSVRWKFIDDHVPQYPIQLSPIENEAIQSLRQDLESHSDVVQVVTDNLQ